MSLREAIKSGQILLFDGGMGTELDKVGLQGKCDANLTHPDQIIEVHTRYFRAGCQAATTNTFLLNELSPSVQYGSFDLDRANREGVRLARQAVGPDRFVLGDLGPTGRLFVPDGPMTEETCRAAFRRQAESLIGEGADCLIIETMASLREALIALDECRKVTDRPIITSMAYQTAKGGGRTAMGDRARDCSRQLTDNGADAVGANCGEISPGEMEEVLVSTLLATELPVIVQPNAGKARLREGRTVFSMSPQEFAEWMVRYREEGATLLGGCCGTTPEMMGEVGRRVACNP